MQKLNEKSSVVQASLQQAQATHEATEKTLNEIVMRAKRAEEAADTAAKAAQRAVFLVEEKSKSGE